MSKTEVLLKDRRFGTAERCEMSKLQALLHGAWAVIDGPYSSFSARSF